MCARAAVSNNKKVFVACSLALRAPPHCCSACVFLNNFCECCSRLRIMLPQFNITYEGYYDPKQNSNGAASTALVLPAFASDAEGNRTGDAAESPDGLVARQTLPALMRVMDAVGVRPWWWAQLLFKLLLRMPYNPESVAEIKAYVRRYADDHLLTQQVGSRGLCRGGQGTGEEEDVRGSCCCAGLLVCGES